MPDSLSFSCSLHHVSCRLCGDLASLFFSSACVACVYLYPMPKPVPVPVPMPMPMPMR